MNTLTDAQLVVSPDVAALLDRVARPAIAGRPSTTTSAKRSTCCTENGFLVAEPRRRPPGARQLLRGGQERHAPSCTSRVLTTLQCNFACDYCFQGDHGDYNKFAEKMSLETAARVARLDRARARSRAPETLRAHVLRRRAAAEPAGDVRPGRARCGTRRRRAACAMAISIITNGLLLTPEVVDRLLPLGLNGVKITLDGDRDTHNRMRPLRGGQGTFDRIIENIRRVAGRVPHCHRRQLRRELGRQLSGAARLPAASRTSPTSSSKVNFKPVVRNASRAGAEGHAPADAGRRRTASRSDGTCMTSAGAGGGVGLRLCDFLDEKMAFLREETKRHGFPTPDGVHDGPVPRAPRRTRTRSARTARSTRAPGSPASKALSTGHIDDRRDAWRESGARAVRPARSLEGVRRLRVHPRVCGGMPGGIAHAAWRHEHADMSQAQFRIGAHCAGA